MKILTLLLLSSFSLTTKAELILNESSKSRVVKSSTKEIVKIDEDVNVIVKENNKTSNLYENSNDNDSRKEVTKKNIFKNIKTSKWVQALDPRITSLSSSIVNGIESDYEKVIAIDDWITQNIVYNYTSTMMTQKIDALTTLSLGMGICTGYSNLFAALARASGLEAKAMTGKAKIEGKTYYHQWNEVKIDGVWYFIDTTWNAGRGRRDYFAKATQYPVTHYKGKEVKSY